MNGSCGNLSTWNGLPSNWNDLLHIQEYELLPPDWRVNVSFFVGTNTTTTSTKKCPSPGSKLGVFAAVNIAMAIMVPILGRRDVVKKITCSILGGRASLWWLLTGPLSCVLHIISNAISASLIKHTPGYESVDVGQLILLWCTRPRLAWMIVALVPFQADNEIYVSVASSTLIAEILLQSIGGYYMGVATNYGRLQHFYQPGRLKIAPNGKSAMLMYAGAVMWASVIGIALVTTVWSLLGLSRIFTLALSTLRGIPRKARKTSKLNLNKRDALDLVNEKLENVEDKSPDETVLVELIPELHKSVEVLSQSWLRLSEYLTADRKSVIQCTKIIKERMKNQQQSEATQSPIAWDEAFVTQTLAKWNDSPDSELNKLDMSSQLTKPKRERLTDAIRRLQAALRSQSIDDIVNKLRMLHNLERQWEIDSAPHFNYNLPKFQDQCAYIHYMDRGDQRWQAKVKFTASEINYISTLRRAGPPGDTISATKRDLEAQKSRIQRRLDFSDNNAAPYLSFKELDMILDTSKSLGKQFGNLTSLWIKERKSREKERAQDNKGRASLLRTIAMRTIAGMVGCWIAQWLWWTGYVHVAGDS